MNRKKDLAQPYRTDKAHRQMRQDVYDFLRQLKTYKSYPEPVTITLDTMRANLGSDEVRRIERAVMFRLAEVSPGVFGHIDDWNKEGEEDGELA